MGHALYYLQLQVNHMLAQWKWVLSQHVWMQLEANPLNINFDRKKKKPTQYKLYFITLLNVLVPYKLLRTKKVSLACYLLQFIFFFFFPSIKFYMMGI